MSAGMSVPDPRAPVSELSLVVPAPADDQLVVLVCGACRGELRHALEPVTPLLDAVGDFVRAHTSCSASHLIARRSD
ncbi:MAG: hypothetical protein JJD92_05490 [Frankiaceae bacterium]|nr:hypothetical protein [Frankiaceae bacterium]